LEKVNEFDRLSIEEQMLFTLIERHSSIILPFNHSVATDDDAKNEMIRKINLTDIPRAYRWHFRIQKF
jgi:hypothetical protein